MELREPGNEITEMSFLHMQHVSSSCANRVYTRMFRIGNWLAYIVLGNSLFTLNLWFTTLVKKVSFVWSQVYTHMFGCRNCRLLEHSRWSYGFKLYQPFYSLYIHCHNHLPPFTWTCCGCCNILQDGLENAICQVNWQIPYKVQDLLALPSKDVSVRYNSDFGATDQCPRTSSYQSLGYRHWAKKAQEWFRTSLYHSVIFGQA